MFLFAESFILPSSIPCSLVMMCLCFRLSIVFVSWFSVPCCGWGVWSGMLDQPFCLLFPSPNIILFSEKKERRK